MPKQRPTRVYWWRDIDAAAKANPDFKLWWFGIHKKEMIRGAWFYELEARIKGKFRFGKPYCELPLRDLQKIRRLWPNDFELLKRRHFPAATAKLGLSWSEPLYFDLLSSDRSIQEFVKRFVAAERKRLGVPCPSKAPKKGERRQKYSWRMSDP
jgi:hypothetical protein